jgi:hypothetical protein
MLEILRDIGSLVGLITGVFYAFDRLVRGRPVASFTVSEENGRPSPRISITNVSPYDITIEDVTISILSERLNVSGWGGSPALILEAATKLDNVIIDMAICDALQDAWFSEAAGYDRPTYCDSHGLRKYRQAGSGTIGRSLERSSNGAIYEFESYGSRNEFVMEKFLEK